MRTNIEIDDQLMAEAMAAGGFATKRETVEAALRMLAQRRKAYTDALALGGQIQWDGDLQAWRRDKPRAATTHAPPLRRVSGPEAQYKTKPVRASRGDEARKK